MRRLCAVLIILIFLLQPAEAMAVPMDFSGGVNNEYEYQEYVFLSGEPVKFTGKYIISQSTKKDQKTNTETTTTRYTFTLTPEDSSITGSLSRQVTYIATNTSQTGKGQTISQTAIPKSGYKETINIDGVKYALKDYQFSKSDVIDNRPVSNYYSGSISGRKYYTINSTEGTATVDISGGDVGYNNFWGNTETQIINNVITVDWSSTSDSTTTDKSWQGTVKTQTSDSTNKTMTYSENEASYSSFDGGYVRTTSQGLVSEYSYDLPKFDSSGIPDDEKRARGTLDLSEKMASKVERLIVPKFRDIGGHWAEDEIKKLYSLDVFDQTAEFFQPEVYMTRTEFTKAVMRACDIRPTVTAQKTTVSTRNKTQEVSAFTDIATTDADYQYIKDALSKGIITGVSKTEFKPRDPLTRAAAVIIMIRALGFENKAPTPGYSTSFDDDASIPSWAEDSIYVAKEIGLISGDNYNNVNANKELTRAEASALLVKFLKFLQSDLQKDYRDNIILYN